MAARMDNASDIASALRATALRGHRVREGLGHTFLVEGVDPARLLEAWRAAHTAMPATGRWPVFTLPGGLDHEPDADEIAELDLAARALDPWPVYQRYGSDAVQVQADAEGYVRAFLGGDVVAAVLEQLTLPTTSTALQRWTYDTLLADPELASQAFRGSEYLVGTSRWPTWPEVQLVLLPTTSQWLAPGWVPYFGATRDNGIPALAAAMWQWEQRWGASLIAAWGTMLQFTAQRRPRPGSQAWELAGQHMAVGGSLQCEQWQLAIALTQGDAWFLHDRP
ncbi:MULTISPECIES: DUF4253 domain-containing protein [Micromonospora]|uniref:DUF4253 domain-containing protein n=1 Tax=Micromonospora TaxID=1873 RepID=UPI001B37507F|nr:DUF4253 domain-containing protein [Micromonospora sp. C81]MBQ1040813.1 DUF4253 domain-containing protein [Micromonospora sp. C81]WTI22281.1 DUF4253 domain-containing protein [Micromonospora zamorensis]